MLNRSVVTLYYAIDLDGLCAAFADREPTYVMRRIIVHRERYLLQFRTYDFRKKCL